MVKLFRFKSQEKAAYKLAPLLSNLVDGYVDPFSINLYSALGYWAHIHQDCQKFTGDFEAVLSTHVGKFTIGSWDYTVSDISRKKFKIYDNRGNDKAYQQFEIGEPD